MGDTRAMGEFAERKPAEPAPDQVDTRAEGGASSLGPGGIQISKPNFQAPQMQAPQMQQQNVNLGQLANRRGGGGPAAPTMPLMPSQGIFRQKAWLPWWLVPVVILLAALLAFLLLLMPKNVVVPIRLDVELFWDLVTQAISNLR